MEIKNILILTIGLAAYINFANPIATLYAMEKTKYTLIKRPSNELNQELFTYFKQLPPEFTTKNRGIDNPKCNHVSCPSTPLITIISDEAEAGVTCLAITDTLLVNGAYDRTAKIWDIYTGQLVQYT